MTQNATGATRDAARIAKHRLIWQGSAEGEITAKPTISLMCAWIEHNTPTFKNKSRIERRNMAKIMRKFVK